MPGVAWIQGKGFLLQVEDGFASVGFDDNLIFSNPDSVIKVTNGSPTITAHNNRRSGDLSTSLQSTMVPRIAASTRITVGGNEVVIVDTSPKAIQTINSYLLPGETVTFVAKRGAVRFAVGGNLSLGSHHSPLTLADGDTITFIRVDSGYVISALL